MLNGYSIVTRLKAKLRKFMGGHGFAAPGECLGLASRPGASCSELDAACKVTAAVDPAKCDGCGRCAVSCRDAAGQAITMADKLARIDAGKCFGCSLCAQVCLRQAIEMAQY
jgi:dihydropyrimidine dehydrogenase (NAD+) subunit PreA